MKRLLLFLFLTFLSLAASSQHIVYMCDDERSVFTYSTYSTQPGEYYWLVDGVTQASTDNTLTIDWQSYSVGDHTIEVWTESIFGCSSEPITYTVSLKECNKSFLYVPNAFTPDGDAFNNSWIPLGWNWKEIHYTIFNRWGEIIFESYDGNVGWDGTYAGRMCQDGVYIYKLKWIDAEDNVRIAHGHINLLR